MRLRERQDILLNLQEREHLLRPQKAVAIALLMLTCAAYAFSGAGLIRKIPLLNLALPTISFICLVRGLYFSPVFFLQKFLAFGIWWQVPCGLWSAFVFIGYI